jgi:RNA polymerase sigma-70 factor (ECF subfamily)
MMVEDPFDGLVAAHHAEIVRYLRRVTMRATEADDLSQETFLRAYRAYRGLPADANVRAWLFAIATNLARNYFRAEKRRRAAQSAVREIGGGGEPSPEAETLLGEARVAIDRAVTALPLKQRLAFTLRKVHDLDYADVAASLECSQDTARAHVFQALRKIRLELDGRALPRTEATR